MSNRELRRLNRELRALTVALTKLHDPYRQPYGNAHSNLSNLNNPYLSSLSRAQQSNKYGGIY